MSSRFLQNVSSAALLALIAPLGCAPVQDVAIPTGVAPNPIQSGIEVVALAIREPANTPRMRYYDDRDFDFALNASMRGETPIIAIDTAVWRFDRADVADGREAARLRRWLLEVRESGGAVIECDEPPPKTRRFFAALAYLVIGYAVEALAETLLYRPAAAYHARAMFDHATGLLDRVEFVLRASRTTPMTCFDEARTP